MNAGVLRLMLGGLVIGASGLFATRDLAFQEPARPTTPDRNWIDTLPADVRASIHWSANYETGNLDQWSIPQSKDPGGGVLNTDESSVVAQATRAVVHSGKFAAEATITNAFRATNGNKAVRLMRWATNGYDLGGEELPQEAYYSTWIYLPEAYDPKKHAPWDPGDGGWWNVFQFKSHDENNESRPVWSLNIAKDQTTGELSFYLYSQINRQKSWLPDKPKPIPVKRWFHVEAFMRVSAQNQGRIAIWLDGERILDCKNVQTSVNPERENIVWGIGNYTDHIAGGNKEGTATIYFDDSIISSRSIAPLVLQTLIK
jgi:hypothetical protein